MGKRIVIALGGNALGSNLPEQMIAVKQTAKAIVDLIEEGHEVIIAHGNGPQVGMIQKAMAELTRSEPEKYIPCPLSVCVAMSQGYIGYDLQNALREELLDRGIQKGVATVLTQVEVDPNDEAFHNPTKPIGAFMTKEEADKMVAERGYNVIEDAGRGYRRVVASPRPQSIIEIQSIRDMVEADEKWLDSLTPDEASKYIGEGHFAPGSMLPKVEAAVEFAESAPGRSALITLLEKAKDGVAGKTGTAIHQ